MRFFQVFRGVVHLSRPKKNVPRVNLRQLETLSIHRYDNPCTNWNAQAAWLVKIIPKPQLRNRGWDSLTKKQSFGVTSAGWSLWFAQKHEKIPSSQVVSSLLRSPYTTHPANKTVGYLRYLCSISWGYVFFANCSHKK